MKVSVIIPCYNVERYLQQSLEKILSQTRKPEEIIAIDDGSTDGTRNILEKFKQIKIVTHRKNKGLAQARNSGIQHAQGEILIFFDADVIPEPTFVSEILKQYTSEKIVGVGGQAIESNIKNIYDQWRKLYLEPSRGNRKIDDVEYISGLCSSYRQKALEVAGGFNPLFRTNAEDFEMGLKLHEAGYRLVYTPEAKVYHQKTDDLKSLLKTGFNYTYWGKIAHSFHEGPLIFRPSSSILLGVIKRITDDLFKRRSLRLAILSFLMFLMECKAQIYFMKYLREKS